MDTPKSLETEKPDTLASQNPNSQADEQLRPLPELEPGQLVSNTYRIISQLGRGGMGFVYLVEHAFLKREFALKTISGGAFSKTTWRRLQKEARATSEFDHPNVIKVHDFGLIADQQPFFVMELVEGDTLAALIEQQQNIPLESVIEIFKQCCRGLAYAHAQGVVHRDIKPGNIMLTQFFDAQKSQVKIVDFGIAKLTANDLDESMMLTRTGEVFGTPYYMSPEQSLGNAVDHRSDIYSLGCVLFETLTGLPPFIGDSALAIVLKHQSEKPPTLKEASLGKPFSQEMERLVAKMLEKEPAHRYQNLHDVESDLERIRQGKQVLLGKDGRKATRLNTAAIGSSLTRFLQYAGAIVLSAGLVAGSFVAGKSMAPSYETKFDKPLSPPTGSETEVLSVNTPVLPPSAVQRGYFSSCTKAQPGTRVFHFPANLSVGRVLWIPSDTRVYRFQDGKLVKLSKIDAMGEMLFENFHPFCLLPSIDSQSHPELLTRFRPDEVIAMDFEHQGLYTDNNTIKNACQIGGLETLVLRECREVTDESIAYIDKLPNFKAIDVAISGVTLDGLLKLHRLRELQRIGAKGYDAHRLLSALKGSQALTSLNLRFSDMSDDDMNLLAGLTKLRHLNISGNKFTDKGFEKLSQLHQLNSLYAEGNRVSGAAAFAALSKLPLKQLHITTTGWSSAALAKLKKALPNCQMNVDTINEPNFAHPDFLEEH